MARSSARPHNNLLRNSADFPFLVDTTTVTSLPQFKVMILMRGLSGSGKTTIVELLQQKYPNTVVCSANAYFYNSRGEYNFDGRKLHQAHDRSKRTATESCVQGAPLIILDNTNIEEWEMGPYLDLAKRHGYVSLLVSPRTPWARDPGQLAQRSRHNVPQKALEKKLESLNHVMPLFYAWFLNRGDSNMLQDMATEYFELCRDHSPIFRRGLETCHTSGRNKLRFARYAVASGHCTCFYIGNQIARPRNIEYSSSSIVQNSLGKVYPLHVIGFVLTESSISARVALDRQQLKLWAQADSAHPDSEQPEWKAGGASSRTSSSNPLDKLPTRPQFAPIQGKGDSAHITLGVVPKTRPAQAGSDLREVVRLENSRRQNPDTLGGGGADVRVYGSGQAVVYLDSPMVLSVLFSGEYAIVAKPEQWG